MKGMLRSMRIIPAQCATRQKFVRYNNMQKYIRPECKLPVYEAAEPDGFLPIKYHFYDGFTIGKLRSIDVDLTYQSHMPGVR